MEGVGPDPTQAAQMQRNHRPKGAKQSSDPPGGAPRTGGGGTRGNTQHEPKGKFGRVQRRSCGISGHGTRGGSQRRQQRPLPTAVEPARHGKADARRERETGRGLAPGTARNTGPQQTSRKCTPSSKLSHLSDGQQLNSASRVLARGAGSNLTLQGVTAGGRQQQRFPQGRAGDPGDPWGRGGQALCLRFEALHASWAAAARICVGGPQTHWALPRQASAILWSRPRPGGWLNFCNLLFNQLLCELRGQMGGVHDRFSFLLFSRSFPLTPTSSPQWKTAPCRTEWCPGNWPISERGVCQAGCSREASPHPDSPGK